MKKQITKQQVLTLNQQYSEYSIDSVDTAINDQLRIARLKALHVKSKQSHVLQWGGGFALASVLLMLMFFQIDSQNIPESNNDFLLAEEMMQLEGNQDIINDIDFYQWLDQQDNEGKLV